MASPIDDSGKKKICFDYKHNNRLKLEDTPFLLLTELLFNSDYLLAKAEMGLMNEAYIKQFDALVIGNMFDAYLEMEEIQNIVSFVKDGGGLLLVSDQGGDFENHNNISELAREFGMSFNPDRVFDPVNYESRPEYVVVKEFRSHPITDGIVRFIHSTGCSITIDEEMESDNLDVDGIAWASETTLHNIYNGIDWIDEPCPGIVILGAARYFKGRVVAIGNLSMFSSLGTSYGLKMEENKKLVSRMFTWLVNPTGLAEDGGEHPVTVPVEFEFPVYDWAMEQLNEKRWPDLSAMVNFSLRALRKSVADLSASEEAVNLDAETLALDACVQEKLEDEDEQDAQKAGEPPAPEKMPEEEGTSETSEITSSEAETEENAILGVEEIPELEPEIESEETSTTEESPSDGSSATSIPRPQKGSQGASHGPSSKGASKKGARKVPKYRAKKKSNQPRRNPLS